MLADPLILESVNALGATAYSAGHSTWSFVCTGRGPTSSTYRYSVSSSHYIDIFVGHQYGKRNRFTIRLTETELVTDPIDSTKNSVKTSTAYVVVDRSLLGAGTNETKMLQSLAYVCNTFSDAPSLVSLILGGQT